MEKLPKDSNGICPSRNCDLCESGIPTRHVCLVEEDEEGKYLNDNGNVICGAFFCCECDGGEGIQNTCPEHRKPSPTVVDNGCADPFEDNPNDSESLKQRKVLLRKAEPKFLLAIKFIMSRGITKEDGTHFMKYDSKEVEETIGKNNKRYSLKPQKVQLQEECKLRGIQFTKKSQVNDLISKLDENPPLG